MGFQSATGSTQKSATRIKFHADQVEYKRFFRAQAGVAYLIACYAQLMTNMRAKLNKTTYMEELTKLVCAPCPELQKESFKIEAVQEESFQKYLYARLFTNSIDSDTGRPKGLINEIASWVTNTTEFPHGEAMKRREQLNKRIQGLEQLKTEGSEAQEKFLAIYTMKPKGGRTAEVNLKMTITALTEQLRVADEQLKIIEERIEQCKINHEGKMWVPPKADKQAFAVIENMFDDNLGALETEGFNLEDFAIDDDDANMFEGEDLKLEHEEEVDTEVS